VVGVIDAGVKKATCDCEMRFVKNPAQIAQLENIDEQGPSFAGPKNEPAEEVLPRPLKVR